MLPRPISICEINAEEGKLRLVYRVVGEGTAEFSGRKAGDKLEILGPCLLYTSYRAWMGAGYTLTTFHWPNIYEIIGNTSMQGQSFEPLATVGLFLALGLLVIGVWAFSQSKWEEQKSPMILELMLFFGLAAAYFLPYMDPVSYTHLFTNSVLFQ